MEQRVLLTAARGAPRVPPPLEPPRRAWWGVRVRGGVGVTVRVTVRVRVKGWG